MAFGSMLLNVVLAVYNIYIWYVSRSYLFLVMTFYYILLALMRFFASFTLHLFFKKRFNDFVKTMIQVCGTLMILLGLILLIVVLSRINAPVVNNLSNWMAWFYGGLAAFKIVMTYNGAKQAKKYQDVLYSLVQRIGMVEMTLTIYTFLQAVIYTIPSDSFTLEMISLAIGLIACVNVVFNGVQSVRYDPRYYEASQSGILFHAKKKKEGVQKPKKVVREGTYVNPWQDESVVMDRRKKVAWTADIEEQLKDLDESPSE